MARAPLIFDIKRGSLDDGPGIRTTVFLKGCPLSCAWCHNPESGDAGPEIAFYPDACIGCGACATACSRGAVLMDLPGRIARDRCTGCGACAEVCPPGAIRKIGKSYSVPDLLDLLLKDSVFYEKSGGGVTFSGGEPLLHMDYLLPVMQALKQRGVHVAVQTAGMFDMDAFREKLLSCVDLIQYDIKFIDSRLHREYTGAGNEGILDNFTSLLKEQIKVIPRTPLVPGITARAENLRDITRFLAQRDCGQYEVLPYNPGAVQKRNAIGRGAGSILPDGMMTVDEENHWKASVKEYMKQGGRVTALCR